MGVMERWSSIIPQRLYSVSGPNELWHMDGNYKLIAWRSVIHGGMDGYSRLIVFPKCSDNNRAETMMEGFWEGARNLSSLPSRIRGDLGDERVQVAQCMEEIRGPDRGSFIHGRQFIINV